jgi:hypothetical protein
VYFQWCHTELQALEMRGELCGTTEKFFSQALSLSHSCEYPCVCYAIWHIACHLEMMCVYAKGSEMMVCFALHVRRV